MPFTSQPVEKCVACSKTVYLTEKTVVEEKTDKKVYHKTCIRCSTCNKVLGVGQYSSMDGQFWCKPHFKQLFATKGNYDEAFGKEKASSKWDASAPTTNQQSSFIPESKAEKAESKPTSEATLEKFRTFREEGSANKCVVCSKTVYLAEKMMVEDKNDKRLYHKTCFKCSVCGMILDLRSYGSFQGQIYCKNHLKEQTALQTSGGSSTGSTYTSSPSSFIPATSEEKKAEKSQTPENIASKFRAQETEKCKACSKTVYATEKVTLPDLKQAQIYHKTCLKCSICNKQLDITNYGSSNGVLYCTPHLKQFGKPEQVKGEGSYFVSPLASTDNNYVPGPPGSDDNNNSNRNDNDDRERGSASESEKERDRDQDRDQDRDEDQDQDQDRDQEKEKERESDSESRFTSGGRSSPALEKFKEKSEDSSGSGRNSPSLDSRERSSSTSRNTDSSSSYNEDDDRKKKEDERQRKREERQRQLEEEERKEEEEREKRRKEREKRIAESAEGSESSSSSTGGDSSNSREQEREERRKKREEERKREEEERERQEEKRKREREDRRRQQDEDAKKELEEQERKAEERRRKLAELKSNS